MTDTSATSSTPKEEPPIMPIPPTLEASLEVIAVHEELPSSSLSVPSETPEKDDQSDSSSQCSEDCTDCKIHAYHGYTSDTSSSRTFIKNPKYRMTPRPKFKRNKYQSDSSSATKGSSDATLNVFFNDHIYNVKRLQPAYKRITPRNKKRTDQKKRPRFHLHNRVSEEFLEGNPKFEKVVDKFDEHFFTTCQNYELHNFLHFSEISDMEAADEDSNPPIPARKPPRGQSEEIPKENSSSTDAQSIVAPDGNSQSVASPGPPPQNPNPVEICDMEAADEDSNLSIPARKPPRGQREEIPKENSSSKDAQSIVAPDENSQSVASPGPPPQNPNPVKISNVEAADEDSNLSIPTRKHPRGASEEISKGNSSSTDAQSIVVPDGNSQSVASPGPSPQSSNPVEDHLPSEETAQQSPSPKRRAL